MKIKFFSICVFFLWISSETFSQKGFHFYGSNQYKQKVSFKLINNLIIFPLDINGKELFFILDTGLSKTILFTLNKKDSLSLKNVKKVKLQGLGNGESIDALLSKNNRFQLKNIISNQEDLYIILNDKFDLSSKMGVTIHGIIGYNLFKNLIVKINYNSQKLIFYNPKKFKHKKCRKCETFPLELYRKKPYINIQIQLDTVGTKKTAVKMLVDSGGSDAVWLFEHTKEEIVTPKRFFNDVLGEGLSGAIYGNRSRIPEISLGKFKIKEPTVSFLDSTSTHSARRFKGRNGSIGGNILKRFKVWIDYPNKKITLKKSRSLTKAFNYNMSGLEVIYNGKVLVKEKRKIKTNFLGRSKVKNKNIISFATSYYYKFKPSYIINRVTKESPAAKAGLQKGDVLVKLNYKVAHTYSLSKIVSIFQEKENKKIRITIQRNGIEYKYKFRLEKKI